MLVLSRLKDEAIVIGDRDAGQLYVNEGGQFVPVKPVRLMVVEIRGDKVRVVIDAARQVPVHREEIFNAIERERQVAG
jgi:carbon storage regulator